MCDAFDFIVGAMLGQWIEKNPIVVYYVSKTFGETHANYSTTEKEFLTIIFAIEKCCSYFLDCKVIIFTNYGALKFLLKKKERKPRPMRWILLIQ